MIWSIFVFLKDILIYLLPAKALRLLFRNINFVFLVHPLELKDAVKKYKFSRFFSDTFLDSWLKRLIPVIGSYVTGFKTSDTSEIKGLIMLSPLTPKQMLREPQLGRKKVTEAVKFSERLGAKIVGLGGFTSIITHDGLDLVSSAKVHITTGNAFSAALIIFNLKKVMDILLVDLKDVTVAIVGAAGSVGFGCSQIIAKDAKKIILVDINKKELNRLGEIIGTKNKVLSDAIDVALSADVIITVTNVPGAILDLEDLSSGTIVIDAAQPKNVSSEVSIREDILVIDSGIAKVANIKYDFDLGLNKEEVYSCFAELLLSSRTPYNKDYYVGKTNPELIEKLMDDSGAVGIHIADFRNSGGFISGNHLSVFRPFFESKLRKH